jgi:hypothetical protein
MEKTNKDWSVLRSELIKSIKDTGVSTNPKELEKQMCDIFENTLFKDALSHKENIIMLEASIRIPKFLNQLFTLFNININKL